ncbi:MAG TPA: hypothetical protein VLK22_01040 [Candidatus Udaeobacter sp.]|nr:hypothetical protein [Candidatus Udaeobacter sp.]
MKLLWKTFLFFISVLSILVIHIFVINFLPFPFNHLNIAFSSLLLFFTINQTQKIIWLSLAVSYFSELFNAIPFGINIAATIGALLIISWFQVNIITNRSEYMVFLSLALGTALYRFLFVIFLTVSNYFLHHESLSYQEIAKDLAWEVLLSSLVLFLFYFIITKLFRSLRIRRIKTEIIYG